MNTKEQGAFIAGFVKGKEFTMEIIESIFNLITKKDLKKLKESLEILKDKIDGDFKKQVESKLRELNK